MKKNKNLKVAIVMGSQSDFKTMKLSANILKKMGVNLKLKLYLLTVLQKECMNLQRAHQEIILE